MKNIFVLPTDQPSRLYAKDGNYKLANSTIAMDWYISSVGYKPYNIYITSDEEIKEGVNQWYLDLFLNKPYQSGGAQYQAKQEVIILTTDPTLIADGVQSINDEFLLWFVKNPTCEFVEVVKEGYKKNSMIDEATSYRYKIIIPQEEPKQELDKDWKELEGANLCEPLKSWEDDKQSTLEEVAEKYSQGWGENDDVKSFIAGGKHMAERMYSKEEVNEIISAIWISCEDNEGETFTEVRKRILEQFKKK